MSVAIPPITVESLLTQAKSLSDADRAELANRLFDTLPPETAQVSESDEAADAAWQEELNRRLDDVANGTADCIPWDQAFGEIREALRRKHGT